MPAASSLNYFRGEPSGGTCGALKPSLASLDTLTSIVHRYEGTSFLGAEGFITSIFQIEIMLYGCLDISQNAVVCQKLGHAPVNDSAQVIQTAR